MAPVPGPHIIPDQPVSKLVETWLAAVQQAFDARYIHGTPVDPADLFAQLTYGARIAGEVTAGRWCVVAELIRTGNAGSWTRIGAAMDMTATDAWDGFRGWITGQVNEYRHTNKIGLTEAEAADLYALAEAVTW